MSGIARGGHGTTLGHAAGPAVFDAGIVSINDTSAGRGPNGAAGLPWVNGPKDRIDDRYGNPAGGRLGFGRDSNGWVASGADLTSYAGHSIRPRFSMNPDNSVVFPGWYLDDIRVYTCGAGIVPTARPAITGEPRVG